ncbi:hypothetical protein SAMN05216312_12225 [Cohnella sp. OV330]|uniref:phage tail terminator family protein n=1 Tax=Cohnella sp. OV330 TaxID=1855288 RepID=UPI0008E80307|nr:hypothetical protein [Cohnella sp. OV330]SFB62604.1 hypothetical protein SAMN05216312_12225 [Cohnella sp. OV330]
MLTRAQLNKAINERIKELFPGIEILSSDVEEGFNRPSFFVRIETNRTENMRVNVYRELTCRILFFPSDRNRYKEEAYNVQDHLESAFGLNLSVEGRTITIDSAVTDIVDRVVHYDFDFSFYDDGVAGDELAPVMEVLEYDA